MRSALAVSIALLGFAVPARAAPPRAVLVLPGTLDPLNEASRAKVVEGVHEEVARRPALSALPLLQADLIDLMVDAECVDVDAPCLARIGKAHDAALVLYVDVERVPRGLRLTTRVVDTAKGTETAHSMAEARLVPDLVAKIPAVVAAVLGPAPAKTPPAARTVQLVVETKPAGALVWLGKERLGKSPVRVSRPPGKYPLRIELPGYEAHVQSVVLTDEPVRIHIALQPVAGAKVTPTAPVVSPRPGPAKAPPAKHGEGKKLTSQWWFWTLIGVGVAGAGIGTAAALGAFSGGGGSGPHTTFYLGGGADRDVLLRSPSP